MKIFNHAAVALATGISIFASTFTPAQAETDWRQETNAYKTASIEKGSADQKTSSKSRTAKASEKPVTVVLKARNESSSKAVPGKAVPGKGAYSAIINKYAATYGVPARLAHAVIRVESNFRPNARGSAGEIGLMQVKPATARMMGYSGSAKGLYHPETNIKFGMKYLAQAHKLGGGTTCGTILKYNAGHGAKRMNPVSARYCSKVKAYL